MGKQRHNQGTKKSRAREQHQQGGARKRAQHTGAVSSAKPIDRLYRFQEAMARS